MTPVERVQAAIDKLKALKTDSTPGPWDWDQHFNIASDRIVYGGGSGENPFVFTDAIEEDAVLIVTLHHTIDPLLSTLERWLEYRPLAMEEPIVALADAILGADS